MKSKKSETEQVIEEKLKEIAFYIDQTQLTISDAKIILECAYKCLSKCEELRISRDNWKKKYLELKHGKDKKDN